jgi:hypothetical protein
MELLLQPVEVIEMDIKRMHCMIEKLSECAKSEMESGIENVDTCEMGKVVDMMKDLSEAMYYRTLTKAMDESNLEETLEMFERYGDGRRFYDKYRYADGRFAPKGRGTYRRGYDEPYYHMTPEMYREHDPEWYRDMDKHRDGLMYYTDTGMDKNMKMRDSREGRSGMSRMSYMESKEMHKADTPADKQYKMKELEKYMGELSKDITEMIADSSQEEKNLLKTKMQTLLQKF